MISSPRRVGDITEPVSGPAMIVPVADRHTRSVQPSGSTRTILPLPRRIHMHAIAVRSATGGIHSRYASVSYKTPPDRIGLDADMNIVFIASVAVIAPDPADSRKLYVDALGLPLTPHPGSDYWSSEQVAGAKHFGVWPLAEAAEACFGQSGWPADRPLPQASIEFEVADAPAVHAAADELEQRGFALLHAAREEPWGQTVARLLSAEGLIVGISFTPALREQRETNGS